MSASEIAARVVVALVLGIVVLQIGGQIVRDIIGRLKGKIAVDIPRSAPYRAGEKVEGSLRIVCKKALIANRITMSVIGKTPGGSKHSSILHHQTLTLAENRPLPAGDEVRIPISFDMPLHLNPVTENERRQYREQGDPGRLFHGFHMAQARLHYLTAGIEWKLQVEVDLPGANMEFETMFAVEEIPFIT